MPASI